MRSHIPLFLFASAVVLLAGCSVSNPTGQASPTGAVQGTSASKPTNFQVVTPNGQVQVSVDGQLPPGWPGDFPTPPNTMAAGSGSLSGSQKGVMVGVYTTTTSAPQVVVYYTSGSSLTTTAGKGAGSGASYIGTMQIVAPYTGSITVSNRSGQTYIVVVLTSSAGSSPSPSQ